MDASRNMNPNNRFSILALDGRGARGMYAPRIWPEKNEPLTGKSTGADMRRMFPGEEC